MTRTRSSPKPRRWKCSLCPVYGIDLDPRQSLEDHYYATHHTPCPF